MKPTEFIPLIRPGSHESVPDLRHWLAPLPALLPALKNPGWHTEKDPQGRLWLKDDCWHGVEYVKAILRRFFEVNPHQLGQYHTLEAWQNTILESKWQVTGDTMHIGSVQSESYMVSYFRLFIELAERGLWTNGYPSVVTRTVPHTYNTGAKSTRTEYALVVPPPKDDIKAYHRAVLQAEVDEGKKLANGFNHVSWSWVLPSLGTDPEVHRNPRRMLYEFTISEYLREDRVARLRVMLDGHWLGLTPDVSGLDPVVIRAEFEAAYRADMITIPEISKTSDKFAVCRVLGLAALRQYVIDLDDLPLMRKYSTLHCDRRPPVEGATVPDFDCSGFPPLTRTRTALTTGSTISTQPTQDKVVLDPTAAPAFKLPDLPVSAPAASREPRRQRVRHKGNAPGLHFELKRDAL